ncbi:MAG: YidC/Oxa1 family insertase periplasmic-domain containing protein, partial [Spirochaetales bacterium]|nr:YidC/Oxa1 family insertase periplasmic-domain containing protein [Spirochaetales bacterium]
MDNNKMFTFMIVLAATFIIMNLYFYYTKPAQNQVQQQATDMTSDPFNQTVYGGTSDLAEQSDYKDRFEILDKNDTYNDEDLIWDNGKIHVEFTPYGGEIKQAVIINGNRNAKADAKLIEPNMQHGAFRMKLGSWADGKTIEELTNGDNYFNLSRSGNDFVFTCRLYDKVRDTTYTIVKTYTMIPDENIFRLRIDLSNGKNEENKFDQTSVAYSLGWGQSLNQSGDKFNKQYDHYAYYDGKKMRRVDMNSKFFRDSPIPNYTVKSKVSADRWFARNDRYFSVLILPDTQSYNYFFDYSQAKDNEFYGGFEHITKKSVISADYYVYMGPQLKSVIKKYDNYYSGDIGISDSQFSKSVRPILWGVGNLMGMFLNLLYKVVRNYGVAIILLTIIIKLLLAPLTHSSMKSQAKMTELQPKVKELQDKYKDNPNQLNQEMMMLYKKAGVNPMGGCLPMLLQMPILIAMYRLLDRMVELKGA